MTGQCQIQQRPKASGKEIFTARYHCSVRVTENIADGRQLPKRSVGQVAESWEGMGKEARGGTFAEEVWSGRKETQRRQLDRRL